MSSDFAAIAHTWHYSSLATANPVVYGIFSSVLGNPLHSHLHSSHPDKPEVQLLERHLRLTVCAWYTQCMIHSQDNLVSVPVHPVSLSWFLRQYHLHATALTEMAGLKTGTISLLTSEESFWNAFL